MLKKSLAFSFIILFLFSINPVLAAVEWEEDFEGGIPDGWDFYSYEMVSGVHKPLDDPGFSVVDGVLRAPNHKAGDNKTAAKRNSTVAYGTWSFDWLASPIAYDSIELTLNHPEHNFNTTGIDISDSSFTGYVIVIDNNVPIIRLLKLHKQQGIFSPTILDSNRFDAELEGTHHIDVTRGSEGQFYVYFNTILLLQATENSITTSQAFGMTSWRGDSGIDNISISNTVDYPSSTIPAISVGYIVWIAILTITILIIVKKKKVKFRN